MLSIFGVLTVPMVCRPSKNTFSVNFVLCCILLLLPELGVPTSLREKMLAVTGYGFRAWPPVSVTLRAKFELACLNIELVRT